MKGVIIACSAFLAILILIGVSFSSLDKTCGEIAAKASELYAEAEEENWDKAYEKSEALRSTWEKKSKWIAMITDHSELDSIMVTMAALKEYLHYREKPELMAEIKTLIMLMEHIPVKEKPTLSNIL